MDFTILPNDDFFAARPLLASLDKSLERRLHQLPSVFERVRSAAMFSERASQTGGATGLLRLTCELGWLIWCPSKNPVAHHLKQ